MRENATKLLTVRITEDDLKRIESKSKKLKITKSKFVKNAIEGDFGLFDIEGCAKHKIIKALNGRGITVFPNTKKEEKLKSLSDLLDFVLKTFTDE